MRKQSKPSAKLSPGERRKSANDVNVSDQNNPKVHRNLQRKRKRRSRYKKLSDKVFKSIGISLSRLLSFVFGFLLILGLVLYVRDTGDDSSPSSGEVSTTEIKLGKSEEEEYLSAVTIPADFRKSSLPVRIDRVNWMIQRCNDLLNQKSHYSEKIEEKMLSLLALKAVMMAESGLDPTDHLDLFKESVAQSSGSATQLDKHQYLIAVTYITALATLPEANIYDDAVEAVNGIKVSTPAPLDKALSCYNSCLKYYVNSADKTAAGKLLRLMGEKLAFSDEQRLSDLGLTLMDYPNFSFYYQGSLVQPKSGTKSEAETLRLLKQVQKTPPQSVKTYDLLLKLPEKYLQAGNAKSAEKILDQFTSLASESNAKIRDKVLGKIKKVAQRVDLLGKKFPVSGVDVTGTNIEPPKKDNTLIIFINPKKEGSKDALVRIADSRLFDRWSTTVFLAPVSELASREIATLKKKYPYFKVVDGPTAVNWIEKSGVDKTPYLLTLDEEGIVRRLSAL